MRGLKSKDLVAIVDFIYHGETSIYQEDLEGFLAIAEELQLKGLTGLSEDILETKENLQNKKLIKLQTTITKTESPTYHEQTLNIVQAMDFPYIEEVPSFVPVESNRMVVKLDPDNQDLKTQLESFMESINDGESNKWKCTVCGKISLNKKDIRRHVETHINGVSHPCNLCGKVSRSSYALIIHTAKHHRK